MEFNTEHIKDCIDAGNFNAIIPLLRLSVNNNRALSVRVRKRFDKHCNRMQKVIAQWMKECRIEFTDAEIENDPEMQELLEALDDANELMRW